MSVIQIQEQIDEASNMSKKDGTAQSTQPSTPAASASKSRAVANKNFVPPALKNANEDLPSSTVEIKPRHNPAAPTALVMPRPPSDLQVVSYLIPM